MRENRFLRSKIGPIGRTLKMQYRKLFVPFLAALLLLAGSFGCGGPPAQQGAQPPAASGSGGLPEITDDMIRERINYTWLREVPPESGTSEPISWGFDEDEPKEITVIEKQMNGPKATIVLDVKTRSSSRSRTPRELSGQIRTQWELRTGWAMRRWEIADSENISFKYKNLPKPTEENTNR